jgi:thiamine kinase-like enzyme
MPLTVEEAILRVPQWAGAKNFSISPLGGGITNNNFRIDIGNEAFVMRIPGTDTELLGINREYEYAANLAAGKLGIAPEVYYFIQPEGYLITRFITGRPMPPEEITRPENICKVIGAIRKIHCMADIPGRFDVFQVVQNYALTTQRYQVAFPHDYDWVMSCLKEAENALKSFPHKLCPCHNDLLNANFITNRRLYILDWEYAGMGDLFFDLGNFSANHDLSDEQDLLLLRNYFDNDPKPSIWAHFKIMKILSNLREAAWGLVQIGISKLDFDFRSYADNFYHRVYENIHNPHWNEWLKEVSEYD